LCIEKLLVHEKLYQYTITVILIRQVLFLLSGGRKLTQCKRLRRGPGGGLRASPSLRRYLQSAAKPQPPAAAALLKAFLKSAAGSVLAIVTGTTERFYIFRAKQQR
jgi:hypothetical protein